MEEEYVNLNGKIQKVNSFTSEEISDIFKSNNWERRLKDMGIFKEIGLAAPKETFLVAGSMSSTPSQSGKVAGVCSLRIDEKDISKGYPINSNHWDFVEYKNRIIMIPGRDKLSTHWFKTKQEWEEEVENNPPHEN